MSAKDIEGFFRKISGSRKNLSEKNTPESDTFENKPLSADLINSMKIDPFQERSSSFSPIANVTEQHKFRRAILQVFDPLRKKSEKSENNSSPCPAACGKILERYNLECVKEDQTHLEPTSNSASIIANNIETISPSLAVSSTLNERGELIDDDTASYDITDQSSDKTIVEVFPMSVDKNYSDNLVDFSYLGSTAKEESQEMSKVSFAATSLIFPKITTKTKSSSSPRYSEDPIRERNLLNMQLKVENEIFHEKLEMMNEENEAVKTVIENCAKQLDEKMIELTNLTTSYDQMKAHFIQLQDAFSNVYMKYYNAKEIIKCMRRNEEKLMKYLVKMQEEIKKYVRMYNELYNRIVKEINELNIEVIDNRKTHKINMMKLEISLTSLRQKEFSLVQELELKTNECQKLANLCQSASGSDI